MDPMRGRSAHNGVRSDNDVEVREARESNRITNWMRRTALCQHVVVSESG